MAMLFDVTQWLTYRPEMMDPALPSGLWFCSDLLDVQAVDTNAACLGLGGSWEDLKHCRDFFAQYKTIFVPVASEERREEIIQQLECYAPSTPLLVPRDGAFHGCKSIHELRDKGGIKAVDGLLYGAKEKPVQGLLSLADIERTDMSDVPCVLSGFQELDRSIGGFYAGEVSVWTGRRGEGKSTLLGQMLLESINQGFPVCAYSGELPAWRFKQWVSLQAAGPDNVTAKTDTYSGKPFYSVSPFIQSQIDEWWRDKFFLYDNQGGSDEGRIIRIFEYACRRYGCCMYLLDNLMAVRLGGSSDADYYRAQSEFTGRLVEFAKKNEVHVHLVAHPRKGDKNSRLEADDVGGSGDVTNRVDNVFSLKRLSEKEAEQNGFHSVLSVLKNRAYGSTISVGLDFDEPSRRFYKYGTGTPRKKLNWEYNKQQEIREVQRDGTEPF